MGGLFSNPEPKHNPPRRQPQTYNAGYQGYATNNTPTNYYPGRTIPQNAFSHRQYQVSECNEALRNLSLTPKRRLKPPEPSRRIPNLFSIGIVHGRNIDYDFLEPYHPDYQYIKSRITNKRFKIDTIETICNPYLQKAYELKKMQKEIEFGYVEERLLFHGTKWDKVGDICQKNFNWRFCQTHKFGKGVSFSPNAMYASNYSDDRNQKRVMIFAKVMIGRSCMGNEFMELPPNGFDTSQKGDDAIVVVKYEDNEFLPLFKITYHLTGNNYTNKRGRASHSPFTNNGLFFDFDY